MFIPPRCPFAACARHRHPQSGFFRRKGYYWPKCRSQPVPRFRCMTCGRGFSRQTFRHDYRDHKPHLNAVVFDRLSAGGGLRELARRIPLTRRNVEMKFRKVAATLGLLHDNVLEAFAPGDRFQLDEMITFEADRTARPLTLPVLIESRSMLIIAACSAPIRPSGRKTPARERRIAASEARHGRRVDRSRECLKRIFARFRSLCSGLQRVLLRTDKKALYGKIARDALGADRLRHEQFSGRLPRHPRNPLFRINLTNAMARDLNGRLRRRSWLASKRREFLDLQLHLFAVYRNYQRRCFNRDKRTPAMVLGWLDRPLTRGECLGWRQDWGELSVHPAGQAEQSFAEFREARAAAAD